MQIPYVNIAAQHAPLKAALLAAMSEVMDQARFILGREVEEFEQQFARLCGVRYALGLNSGTDALLLTLRALGIGAGDEVITVPNSFVASTSCIALLGARPVFVDVGADYNIDPGQIEPAINRRTRAILPVHLTGRPADMEPIMQIARAYGLHVIEDCAQAVCATYKGQSVGSFGIAGCFSLHPLKTLGACGDAGILTTNDEGLYERCRRLRNLGLQSRDDCRMWGHNSRLDTLQAAILLVKLPFLQEWTEKRRANARMYQQRLSRLRSVQVPIDRPYESAVYHTFIIQAEQRDALRHDLAARGIGTAIHYPVPIHLQTAAADLGYRAGSFPVAERQAQRILSLPVYPELDGSALGYIVDTIHRFYAHR